MLKYIVLIVFAGVIFAGAKLLGMTGSKKPIPSRTGIEVVGAVPVEVVRDGSVLYDHLRATAPGFLMTAEHGIFAVGEDCDFGFVDNVGRGWASIRLTGGGRARVETRPSSYREGLVGGSAGDRKPSSIKVGN